VEHWKRKEEAIRNAENKIRQEPATLRQFVVEDEHGPDLKFEGVLLFEGHHHDIGSVTVHRTAGGKYVVKQNVSSRPGVDRRYHVRTFDDPAEAADWLGHSRGAKEVRKALGLPTTKRIP
jgi:hypothetical protein